MPKVLYSNPSEAVLLALQKHPSGASLEEVLSTMSPAPSVRTLSRWLDALVQEGRVMQEGSTRGSRYRLAAGVTVTPAESQPAPSAPETPTSPVIPTSISAPITQPVSEPPAAPPAGVISQSQPDSRPVFTWALLPPDADPQENPLTYLMRQIDCLMMEKVGAMAWTRQQARRVVKPEDRAAFIAAADAEIMRRFG